LDIGLILRVYIIDANALGAARRCSAFDFTKISPGPLFQRGIVLWECTELQTAYKKSPFFKRVTKGDFGWINRSPRESYGGFVASIAAKDFTSGKYI
jgi:hypothetical protein